MSSRFLIVGSGIAGLSAAEAIREREPGASLTLVSQERHPFYSRPGLAYLLSGEVPERQLAIRTSAELCALRLDRLQGRATAIDVDRHELALDDGRRVPFDRLLLATGAASIAPSFPGAGLDGVVRLDSLDDARDILARTTRTRAAAVVGGGSTALELVDGLHARGLETHYLMRGARYWSRVLDPVESGIIEQRLERAGVILHHHAEIGAAIGTDGRLEAVETTRGERIACELLAVGVGVRPRLDVARAASIHTERGIVTDEWLQTTAPDVFAAGDVAQALDVATGGSALDTLWASACAMGRTAGRNMTGATDVHRKRPPLNVTRIGGVTTTIVGAVGGADDPDLLTLTRGQSERWSVSTAEWTLQVGHAGDRIRALVGPRSIVGAVVMGDQSLSRPLARLIAQEVDVSALRPALEAHPGAGIAMLAEFIHAWEDGAHATDR